MLWPKAAAGPLEKWGRLEKDMESGALRLPAWGATSHWTMPFVEWAYAYMLGAGDPTWHGFMAPTGAPRDGTPLEKSLEKLSKKTIPYTDDIFMFNYAWKGEEAWKTGIYSPHKAKQVAWSRHYTAFWNESMALCEMLLPELGSDSPEIEFEYYKAVTGKKDSFADTMRIGQKIWTLERAIRVMHGRSRQTEDFFPYMYKPGPRAWRSTAECPFTRMANGVTIRPRTCTWTGRAWTISKATTMPWKAGTKNTAGRPERRWKASA